jgi:hypothetical protein
MLISRHESTAACEKLEAEGFSLIVGGSYFEWAIMAFDSGRLVDDLLDD